MSWSSNSRMSGWAVLALAGLSACGSDGTEPRANPRVAATAEALKNRAYIVSLESDELTVIDIDKLEIIGRVATAGHSNHMADVSADFKKVFIDSSHSDELIVVDAEKLEVTNRVKLGKHPAHLSMTPDGNLFAVMVEDDNEIAFFDPDSEKVVKRLSGFSTPHFMRFDQDNEFGYVANIGGNHITRVDLEKLEIVEHIPLDGMEVGETAEEEGGFADAQISPDGILYAAHHQTGRVLVYDTKIRSKMVELESGKGPWVAFAEHPYKGIALKHLVPNFGDRTLTLIDADEKSPKVWKTLEGDEEAYGVNFSPLVPELAFVMNRVREDIAVVDVDAGEIIERIEVGGNTETAATTADGTLIIAAVSGADKVVVIDVKTRSIKKVFENVGKYPWSVTIPGGQNYCH
jgi:DNA-binding beta-propeller fold protein YncE